MSDSLFPYQIKDNYYDDVNDFHEGMSLIKKGNKYGFIDKM